MSEDGEGLDDWEAAMAEQAEAEASEGGGDPQDDIDAIMNAQAAGDNVADGAQAADGAQRAELDELQEDAPITVAEKKKLDTILDIPVTISMEVGRSEISIRNLLQLNQGSVVELDRVAGEPLDVLVNGTLIAHGEVVVINDKFGIRLTDVISQVERIKKLR
ncbi:MAG: flagellar motor switch protein FliN/FliY [Glaciecola sp.]|jgi:flagellar motor switch protein FliN/FliY